MRFSSLALALGIAAAPMSIALAGDCRMVEKEVPETALWRCSTVWVEGSNAESQTECFANPDDGFTWVAKQFSRAGHIRQASCRNQGKTVRYRDWYQQRKAAGG